jgi:hypothetical protein
MSDVDDQAANNNEDDKGAGEKEETKDSGVQPHESLDDVHERVMNDLDQEDPDEGGNDDDKAKDDAKGDDSGNADDSDDDADASSGEDKDKKGGDADDDTSGKDDSSEEDKDQDKDPPKSKVADPPKIDKPEVDTDITKPGKYKQEFVDINDDKHYVSDLDELPDDFEPKNFKEYGKAIQGVQQKQAEYNRDDYNYRKAEAHKQTDEDLEKLQESWDKDIATLDKDGILPKDKSAKQKEVEAVYDLMEGELKKGNVIDSFKSAHEMYKYREGKKKDAQKKDDQVKDVKKRGSKVMGGSSAGANTNSSGGKTREAPPQGSSLDDVHEHVMNNVV